MFGELRGPQAEAVVVFGGQDEKPDSGILEDGGPLPGVEVGGIEPPRIFLAVAPLAVSEGVHAEMSERDELVPLPGELLRGGNGKSVGGAAEADGNEECRRQNEE